jgi:hypothetical protein
MDPKGNDLQQQLKERLSQLPKVVQDAITSSDVEKRLRTLSDTHKLHLDQWQIFENEVMLALLGFQHIEDLQKNIQTHVGVAEDVAHALAESANTTVFEPIRAQLERELEHPDAKAEQLTDIETARAQNLQTDAAPAASTNAPSTPVTPAPTIAPATPPAPPPEVKVTRPSESTAYRPGEISTERKVVVDDPYREPIV